MLSNACNQKLEPLYQLIANHEDWLMLRILEYAKKRGYTTYTSTLAEAWRVSICGLSSPLLQVLQKNSAIPELEPDTDYTKDPIAAFGVVEAQRHRNRGITISLFLGLMKYYRQSYLDLMEIGNFSVEQNQYYQLFINRFFDRIELGFCEEWSSITREEKIADLQRENRILTNEKNKYLTVFESLNEAIFLLDKDNKIINLNEAAAVTFTEFTTSGKFYYSQEKLELPWLEKRVANLSKTNQKLARYELILPTKQGERWFELKLKQMVDVSEKFLGTVAICSDITEQKEIEAELRKSTANLKEAQRIGHLGHWWWDLTTGEMFWSEEIYKIFGKNPEKNQPSYQHLLSQVHPEDINKIKQLEEDLFLHGKKLSIDHRIVRTDGSICWVHAEALATLDDNRKPIRWAGTLEDITSRKIAEEALRESEELLRRVINSNVNGIVVLDKQGKVLLVNPAAESLFGRQAKTMLGELLGLPVVVGESTELEIYRPTGAMAIAEMRVVEISWNQPAYLVSLVDITARKQVEEKLKIFWLASEQSPASIVITKASGEIEYVNRKFQEITGYTLEEAQGKNPRILKSDYTSSNEYQELWQKITSGQEWHGEFHNKKKNGELFWEQASISPIKNEAGQITHFVGVKEDITQRKENEALLEHQANYDPLTDLPNRILVMDRLEQALHMAEHNENRVAVMFIDLDNFKNINDTLGHELGDQLLQQTATRLQKCLRKNQTVARLGGDEFLIIVPDLELPTQCENIAKKILTVIAQPFNLSGEEAFISASIGITIYPEDGSKTSVLLRNADTAMYGAKKDGKAGFKFFTPSMNFAAQKRLRLETHLRHALEKNELHLFYQPFIELKTNQVVGAEALMRWQSQDLGNVTPEQFIPVAEETGLIYDLGKWALFTACQELATWQQLLGNQMWIAVNMSPRQFREPNLVEVVSEALITSGIPSSCLELEITERLLVEDIPGVTDLIAQFKQMNIRLAIDDFGTGYSSLNYLRKFPFNVLKIDRSFITDVPENGEVVSLVRTIIAMAHGLKLKVVAEGVETPQQLNFLRREGCDYVQGYFFSQPLPSSKFREYLINSTNS